MKIPAHLLLVGLLPLALLALPQSGADAQVAVGVHGTVLDVRGATWGLGGRLGVVLSSRPGLNVTLEGVGEYLFPSCDVVDCSAYALKANLIGRKRVSGIQDAYMGLGIVYGDFTLEDGGEAGFEGNDMGLNILFGTQSGQPGGIRPFLEVHYAIMDDLANQVGATLGVRIPIAGARR